MHSVSAHTANGLLLFQQWILKPAKNLKSSKKTASLTRVQQAGILYRILIWRLGWRARLPEVAVLVVALVAGEKRRENQRAGSEVGGGDKRSIELERGFPKAKLIR